MRYFGYTTDQIAASIASSDLIEYNAATKSVCRRLPLLDPKEVIAKSIFAKDFPISATKQQIVQFFEQNNCKVISIKMIYVKNTFTFMGSCYAEFESPTKAQNISKMCLTFDSRNITISMMVFDSMVPNQVQKRYPMKKLQAPIIIKQMVNKAVDYKSLRWQVEFYFCDANLLLDDFLLNKIAAHVEKCL